MTDLEIAALLARIELAESEAALAERRSQLALRVATALRNALAARDPEFDAEYLKQIAELQKRIEPS